MKIYTKTGDSGETGLLGGERVSKDSLRIEAYGTVDELNSFIGKAVTVVKDTQVRTLLEKIQNELFTVGADLASPGTEGNERYSHFRAPKEYYLDAEKAIDHYSAKLDELKNFIIPGGTESAVTLHICRTICRRAERRVVALNNAMKVEKNIIIFLNRLSDLFFVLARYENSIAGIPDIKWTKI